MSMITIRKTSSSTVWGGTGAAAGAFDTAAPLDAYAARTRNLTMLAGNINPSRGVEHTGTPQSSPSVMDRRPD
jgi:hypothetical protein